MINRIRLQTDRIHIFQRSKGFQTIDSYNLSAQIQLNSVPLLPTGRKYLKQNDCPWELTFIK